MSYYKPKNYVHVQLGFVLQILSTSEIKNDNSSINYLDATKHIAILKRSLICYHGYCNIDRKLICYYGYWL